MAAIQIANRPVKSPLGLYKIDLIDVNLDDDDDAVDQAPTETEQGGKRPMVVKMKKAVAQFLGLSLIAYDDPVFEGTFGGSGLNQGAKFRKRVGGRGDASYKLVAKDKFTISEYIKTPSGTVRQNGAFRSIEIGFPRGHSVHEVIAWLATTPVFSQIGAIVPPSGSAIPLNE